MKSANIELNRKFIGKSALCVVGLVVVSMLVVLVCVHFKTTVPPLEVSNVVAATLLARLLNESGLSISKRPALFLALLAGGLITVKSVVLTLMWVAVKTAI